MSPGLPLSWYAVETPFKEIVEAWPALRFAPVNNLNDTIDALGWLEFGLYGLAVDYSSVIYISPGNSCGTGDCGRFPPAGESYRTLVTLCGKCVDSSDIGNMMFGLGGAARGYDPFRTWGAATAFNLLTFDPNLNDGLGSWPGYAIGSTGAYRNQAAFCSIVNGMRGIGYNDAQTLSTVNQCAACTTDRVVGIANKFTRNPPEFNPSSLNRLSDNASTIGDLRNKIGGFLDKLVTRLLVGRRRLKGKKRYVTIWLLCGLSLTTALTGCGEQESGGEATAAATPTAGEIQQAPAASNTPAPAATATPTLPPATGTPPPTLTPTMTLCPMEVTAQHSRQHPPFHQVLSYMV